MVASKPVSIRDLRDLLGFRQVAYLTFLLNQSIAPFDPSSFRIFNIALHVLNSFLVYALTFTAVLLCLDKRPPAPAREEETGRTAYYAALLGSLLFGLHPVNINAVAYIVQRMAALATMFVLLSVLCYSAAARSGSRPWAFLFYALSAISMVMGVFSKENAVMALPLVLLFDAAFISGPDRRLFLRRAGVSAAIALLCIAGISLSLQFHRAAAEVARIFLSPGEPITAQGWTAVDVYWTPLEHVLTAFRVVARYLVATVVPLPQMLVFDWWGFPLSTGLLTPATTLAALLAVAGLVGLAVWKFNRLPLLSFGVLWYFLAISLESFVAVGSDLYFEHRNYLPLAGLFAGTAGQVMVSLGTRLPERGIRVALVAVALALGCLTFMRNTVWKDSVTLWTDTLGKAPTNIRAMIALGNAYFKELDFPEAERHYREALKAGSTRKRARFVNDAAYSLGMMYLMKGDLKSGKALEEAFDKSVESYRPRILRGFHKALSKDAEGALREYAAVIGETRGTDTVVIHTLTGDAYRELGDWDQAIAHYDKALSLDPGFSAAHYGMGVAHMGRKDAQRAYESFSKALSADPSNVLALADMADLMLIRGSLQKAQFYAERAVSKSPPLYQPYLSMAGVLIVGGREAEAEGYYREAADRGMAPYMMPLSKARAYYMKGDRQKTDFYLAQLRTYKDLPEAVRKIAGGR